MTKARALTRVLSERFWKALDSNAVLFYQSLIYPAVFLGGWAMLLFGMPKALDNALSGAWGDLWITLCMAGPPVTLGGYLYRHRDEYAASLIQASGNITVGFVFLGYVLGVVEQNGGAVFSPFVFFQLGLWSFVLALRDARKVLRTELKLAMGDRSEIDPA